MHKTFTTEGPVALHVEIGSGDVRVEAVDTTTTEVQVEGRDADDVTVEQRGDQIVVLAERRRTGFFSTDGSLRVRVTLPRDSDLSAKLGSADLVATGRYAGARVRTGSGEVSIDELAADAVVETGSGDVEIDSALSDLRIKTGSGEVQVSRAVGSAVVSTGSGDIELGEAGGVTSLKTGSGDVEVKDAHTDVAAATGSGDVHVGRIRRGTVRAKAASGDIHVGVPAGVPVWTDISCVTGSVRSNLQGAGQPEEGQDHIEIRATTVSGDINLAQL